MKKFSIVMCALLLCTLNTLVQAQDNVGLTMYFPTGVSSTSVIMLEKSAPRTVVLNKSFSYTLKVTNISKNPVSNIKLTETLADGFNLTSSSPNGQNLEGGKVQWQFASMRGCK